MKVGTNKDKSGNYRIQFSYNRKVYRLPVHSKDIKDAEKFRLETEKKLRKELPELFYAPIDKVDNIINMIKADKIDFDSHKSDEKLSARFKLYTEKIKSIDVGGYTGKVERLRKFLLLNFKISGTIIMVARFWGQHSESLNSKWLDYDLYGKKRIGEILEAFMGEIT